MASKAAGYAVVTVVGSGILAGAWAAAPDFVVLGLWGAGAVSVWWAVSRPNKIDIPSPPPPGTPLRKEKPQISVVQGDHPHHWKVIHRPVDDDDEGTTS